MPQWAMKESLWQVISAFSLEQGDYLCIAGENGSGKTTLMKTLLGFLKPISGSVSYGRKDQKIGYLPQSTETQKDFPASVNEIVLSGCLNHSSFHPFYTKEEKKTALENMKKLEILPLKDKCFRELSGGQKQRVLLARALCAAEDLLLVDEPVSGLDNEAESRMYQVIEDLNKKDHMTIIMITHDLSAAEKYASHILKIGDRVTFEKKQEGGTETWVSLPIIFPILL